uniref:Ribosomal RNA-processing protein 8 n=1 Tax=Geotrypetes seraphini TaxID=260995 RepID=A0A6P8RKJ4_GEOSA|nr:ribosomal RNA-processing protein 8 isoform X2 [Geotrypetes seraphini]
MFDTGDWNDSTDAEHLSKSIHHHCKSFPGVQEPAIATGNGQKLLRKHLLETLRVLEAASQSYQDEKRPLLFQDLSKCEDDEAETTVTCSKHKKKTRKKNLCLNLEISKARSETPVKKKKQNLKNPKMKSEKPATKLKESRGVAQEGPGKEMAMTVQTLSTRLEGEPVHQLSRKQWKNKQKNKKRNTNKFKMTPESKGLNLTEPRTNRSMKSGTIPSLKSDNCAVSKGSSFQDNIALSRNGPKLSPQNRQVTKAHLKKLKKILGQKYTADVSAVTGKKVEAKILQQKDPEGTLTQEGPDTCANRSAALRSRMEERLKTARFRCINQQLYTSSSQEAQRLFQQDPEAFQIYHYGFSAQLQRWPQNPTDEIIKYLRNRPASLVVADFGCGDCKIALSVRNTVHSFDLVALNDLVTVCDMAKVPLQDESVDIAVFCLALMGTNLREFLEEANRVLKPGI